MRMISCTRIGYLQTVPISNPQDGNMSERDAKKLCFGSANSLR